MVYVATGNNYADPSQRTSDAVIAFDMNSGTIKWVTQATPNDNWTMGCRPENPDNPNCPAKMGPDYDFSASPSLATVNGRDLLVLPQKSGMAYALDPDWRAEGVGALHRPGSGLEARAARWTPECYFGVSTPLQTLAAAAR
jgi:polyvinyl alcohol dehydrogenase (cytochrome)